MRLAVTEACTNVVRHAYADGDGTIDVVVRPEGQRARGRSSRTRAAASGPSPDTAGPGLGLPLIAALADTLEIERTAERGQPPGDVLPAHARAAGDGARVTEAEPPTKVSIAAGPLVGPVLRRVVGMFAARADLPLDRLDDAVLVADVVAARAPAHVGAMRPSTSRSRRARARSTSASGRCAPAAAARWWSTPPCRASAT